MNNKRYNNVMRTLRRIRKWTDQAKDPESKAEFLMLFCQYSERNKDILQSGTSERCELKGWK